MSPIRFTKGLILSLIPVDICWVLIIVTHCVRWQGENPRSKQAKASCSGGNGAATSENSTVLLTASLNASVFGHWGILSRCVGYHISINLAFLETGKKEINFNIDVISLGFPRNFKVNEKYLL